MPDVNPNSNNDAVGTLSVNELINLLIASGMGRSEAERLARSDRSPQRVLENMLKGENSEKRRATRVLAVVTGGAMEGTQEAYATFLQTNNLAGEEFAENQRVPGFDYNAFNDSVRTTNPPSAEFGQWVATRDEDDGDGGALGFVKDSLSSAMSGLFGLARSSGRGAPGPSLDPAAIERRRGGGGDIPEDTEDDESTGDDPLAVDDSDLAGETDDPYDPTSATGELQTDEKPVNYTDFKTASNARASFNSSQFGVDNQFLDSPGTNGRTLGSTSIPGVTRLGIDPGDLGINPEVFYDLSGGVRPSRNGLTFGDIMSAGDARGSPRPSQSTPGLSWNQARTMLFKLPESELENLQRHLWQMGYFGDEAIANGQVPKFGFLEQPTTDAYMNFLKDVFSDSSLDSGVVAQRRIRMYAPVHEAAAAGLLNAAADLQAPYTEQVTRQSTAAIESQLQAEAEDEMGRRLTSAELANAVSSYRAAETRNAESTFAQNEQLNRMSQAFANQGGVAGRPVARDALGYPIGQNAGTEVGPDYSRNVVPFSPSGTVANPADGLTEGNIQAVLRAIRWSESGDPNGNYSARNKKSSAGGAYQFVDGTWLGAGGTATQGGGKGNGFASYASPVEQDRVARQEVIRLFNQYGNWDRVFMAWFLPGWIGVREDTPVPGHNGLTLRKYAERGMDRAFGRQAASLGPPGINEASSLSGPAGLVAGSVGDITLGTQFTNDTGQELERDPFQSDITGAQLDALAGGGLYFNEQLDPQAELERSIAAAHPEEVYGHQLASQFANFRRLMGGNY